MRAIVNDEYADAPVDEPGNDDLGALSSWYVWAALGLFPITPGTATLALASPLFPSVRIQLPDGHRLVEDAPGAAASRPYIRALTVHGVARPAVSGTSCASASNGSSGSTGSSAAGQWDLPWLPASVDQERRHARLHPLGSARSLVGGGLRRRPAVLHGGPAPRRGLLAPERRPRP